MWRRILLVLFSPTTALLLVGAVSGYAGPGDRPALQHHLRASTIPDPDPHEIPDMLTITPDGSFGYTVLLRHPVTGGPLPNQPVEIEFSPEAGGLIAWADGQEHPLITGVTDQDGVFTFTIAGAGCIDRNRFGGAAGYIFQVRSEGIILAEPEVNSPDAVNSLGKLPAEIGTSICEDGQTKVGVSDAVFHTGPIKRALVEPCSKFTEPFDDPVGIADAVILTGYVLSGVSAACAQ